MTPKEVTVQLRGKLHGKDWLIEEVVLNKKNNFTFIFENLPAKIDNVMIKDIIYFVELGVDHKNVEISEPTPALSLKIERPQHPVGTLDLEVVYSEHFKDTGNTQYYDEKTGNLVGSKDFSVKINLHNKITGTTKSKFIDYKANHYEYEGFTLGKWDESVIFKCVPVKNNDGIKIEYYKNKNSADGMFEQYLLEYDVYLEADDEGRTIIKLPDIKPKVSIGILRCEIEPEKSGNKQFIITLHNTEKIDISGSKTWDDNDDQDGKRPASITVRLSANGKEVASKSVNAEDDWKWTFANLPKYEDGEEIVYTITEDPVEGYNAAVNGYIITNSHTPETVNISGSKTWDDNNDQDGKRPASITVRLSANGKEVASKSVNAEDDWKWTFANLPKYEDGEEIVYTITEDPVEGYNAAVNGYIITNSHTPETVNISGSKTWDDNNDQDGKRPASITVRLSANGKEVTSKSVNAKDDWKWTFTNLPKYENGEEIVYTITEDPVEGYNAAVNGYDITNSHKPETVNISGSKTWDDNNDQDGKRPASITVRLSANGKEVASKSVSAEDDWKWTFANLPKYENGKEIKYTFKEDAVKGYTTTVSGNTITNAYITPAPTPAATPVTPTATPEPDYPTIRVPLKVTKRVENGKLKADQFTFVLKDSHGKELAKAANDAEGAVIFPDRTFSRVVENYTYTIEELTGDEENIVYDKTVYTVKATTKDVNGRLQARVDIEKDGVPYDGEMLFTNTCSYPKTGDSMPKVIFSILLAAFAIGMGAIARKNKRSDI